MLRFPLKVRRHQRVVGEPCSFSILDAGGRAIRLYCDIDQLRRDVAHLWTPEEAEALAKTIARLLTQAAEQGDSGGGGAEMTKSPTRPDGQGGAG